MVNISKRKLKPQLQEEIIAQLVHYVSQVRKTKDAREFLFEFLTPAERVQLGKRLTAIMMLISGYSFTQIENALKISPATVAKLWRELKNDKFIRTRSLSTWRGRSIRERSALESFLQFLTNGLPPRAGKKRWEFLKGK